MNQNKSLRVFSATFIILLLVLSPLSILAFTLPFGSAQPPQADLTGRIYDHGEDTDGDGLFDFLVVDVEVEVNTAGKYQVGLDALRDDYNMYLYFYARNETYLDVGMHNVSFLLAGIVIHGSHRDFLYAYWITLSYTVENMQLNTVRSEIPLPTPYTYALFDNGAALTGKISTEGNDTDGDGLFNYLELTAEINVTDEGEYVLTMSGLYNVSEYGKEYISTWTSAEAHLSIGLHDLKISLPGPTIYASHATNISEADIAIDLHRDVRGYPVDHASFVPLTRAYSYREFDTPAHFTGAVSDVGVDNDGDAKYDYLELTIGLNVTEAGQYTVLLQDLLGNFFNRIIVYETASADFDVGVHLVNFTVYGPRIYAAHVDPMSIGAITLLGRGWNASVADILSNVQLPTLYAYGDFESHAYFTGAHSDVGIDTDGDGLFDYLAVGIDVNVTEAGGYGIYAIYLMGQGYFYVNVLTEGYYTTGVHRLYLNYSGPMLAQQHFSPTSLSEVVLYEGAPSSLPLDKLPAVPFSQQYDYHLFDAPIRETKIDFVVYPNGTVTIDGKLDYTHLYSTSVSPTTNVTVDFSTDRNTTMTLVNGTVIFPPTMAPLNSTTAHLSAHYGNGSSNATLEATVAIPSDAGKNWPFNSSDFTLNAKYANGQLGVDLSGQTVLPSQMLSTYPFNITDVVVLADYQENNIKGNVTFRAVSGLPFGDVIVYVNGSRTELHLTGNLTVLYGNFFGTEVTAAKVDDFLGNFTSMIDEASGGSVQCTQLETAKTALISGSTEYGAYVDYNITLQGNFTGALARLVSDTYFGSSAEDAAPVVEAALESLCQSVQNASVKIVYYYASKTATIDLHATSDVKAGLSKALELVPAAVPSENRTMAEAWVKIVNATAYAYESLSFNASYSSATQEIVLKGFVSVDTSLSEKDIMSFTLDTVSPDLRGLFESYMNTTYCKLKSATATFDSTAPGVFNFMINETYEGDFSAQLNHEMRFIRDYADAFIPNQPPYYQPSMLMYPFAALGDVELDINNFKADLSLGSDHVYLTFGGLILQVPKDAVDSVEFRLSTLFNMTAGFTMPQTEFDTMKIDVTGGADANQTVILYAPPLSVPTPTNTSLNYESMIWQNTAPANLKDLRFLVAYRAAVDYAGVTESIPIVTNSTISDFNFDPGTKSMSFDVEGTSGTGYCNVTIPKSVLYASGGNWSVKIDGVTLPPANLTIVENAEYAFIFFSYSHSRHTIEIIGTWVVPEYQPNLLLVTFIAASLLTVMIAVRQRRKIFKRRARSEHLLHTFHPVSRRTKT